MVLDGNSAKKCRINDGVPQGSVIYINYLPGVICNLATYVKRELVYDFLQQLECDPRDTVDADRKLILGKLD